MAACKVSNCGILIRVFADRIPLLAAHIHVSQTAFAYEDRLNLARNQEGQKLPWLKQNPVDLRLSKRASNAFRSFRDRGSQAAWLGQRAMTVFGPKRCVGFAGSFRSETSAAGGSIFWSLLLHGKLSVPRY